MTSQQLNGLGGVVVGGLIGLIFLIFCVCGCCYMGLLRKRREQQDQHMRTRSMVYSVTMQGWGGSSFYNSVTEYLRNSQTNQAERDATDSQRQLNDNSIDGKMLSPQGLPSYDDVISGKYDGNIEPPPPYLEQTNCNIGDTSTRFM